jgi:hypothetical protein
MTFSSELYERLNSEHLLKQIGLRERKEIHGQTKEEMELKFEPWFYYVVYERR